MGFFGGFDYTRNPGGQQADDYLSGADDMVAGAHSAGNRWARGILGGLRRGDTSAIGDPFAAQAAAAKRNNMTNEDPFLPPELANAQARLANSRVDEQHGNEFENYVRGSASDGAHLNTDWAKSKYMTRAQLAQARSQNALDQYQGHQTQGYGSALMGGVLGALQFL